MSMHTWSQERPVAAAWKHHAAASAASVTAQRRPATDEPTAYVFQRWIPEILVCLTGSQSLRYGEIQTRVQGIGSKTLARKLRRLCTVGVVVRTQYDEIPPRVEYSLSGEGRRFAQCVLEACDIASDMETDSHVAVA